MNGFQKLVPFLMQLGIIMSWQDDFSFIETGESSEITTKWEERTAPSNLLKRSIVHKEKQRRPTRRVLCPCEQMILIRFMIQISALALHKCAHPLAKYVLVGTR